MQNTDFRKLQMTQLEILKFVHHCCEKYGIEYFLIGGTLLGAKRHKGFIPWDIDIDIAMTRENYDKFLQINDFSLNYKYNVIDYSNDKYHFSPHAKVILNQSKLIYSNKKIEDHIKNHKEIYIDVFPLDKVPVAKQDRESQMKKIKRIKKLVYYKVGSIYDYGIFMHKYFFKKIFRFLLFPVTFRYLNKKLDETMTSFNGENSNLVCSMASHYSYEKQTMTIDVYRPACKILFEGYQFYAPNKVEEYLERIYGNYNELPPIEKRNINLSHIKNVIYPLD